MAMWRRPVVEHPPAYLLEFHAADWISSGYEGKSAWQRWSDARFEYLLRHRDRTFNGLDIVAVIYEEP